MTMSALANGLMEFLVVRAIEARHAGQSTMRWLAGVGLGFAHQPRRHVHRAIFFPAKRLRRVIVRSPHRVVLEISAHFVVDDRRAFLDVGGRALYFDYRVNGCRLGEVSEQVRREVVTWPIGTRRHAASTSR